MKNALTVAEAAVFAVFSLVAEQTAGVSAPGSSACADPAADIEVALISKTGPFTGRVRITGIVKNLGNTAWKSTARNHRLQMVLMQKNSDTHSSGDPVEPPLAVSHMKPGQQFRTDHQVDWNAKTNLSYPGFIVRLSDSGRVGGYPLSYIPDCRSDNNRKEISAADINKLFNPAPASGKPLEAQGYRLLGGVGGNTVESTLVYKKTSSAAGKITASVAAPYSGIADEVPVTGNTGNAIIRVRIPCDREAPPGLPSRPVAITYRLWNSLGQPGTSRWVAGFSTEQFIPYGALCAARR